MADYQHIILLSTYRLLTIDYLSVFYLICKKNRIMETLIVKPKNTEELLFVQMMLNRMKIKSEVQELEKKKRLKKEFLDSFDRRVAEVNQAIRGEIELQSLDDFLDEIRNNNN